MPKQVYTLGDLRNWPAATGDEPHPVRFAVIGDPVAHSLSPQMHNAGLEALEIPARYVRLHLTPEELPEAVQLFRTLGLQGVNVTIPHKAAVMALADELSEHARDMGVVNTLHIKDGKLHGSSTDGPGFIRAVKEEFGVAVKDLRVLVLGAGGGAGRAVALQCAMEHCPRLVLVNRTQEKAEALANEWTPRFSGSNIEALPMTESALAPVLGEIDLIVNATSLGMQISDASPLPPGALGSRHMLYDTVYSGGTTRLVQAVRDAGGRTANGLSMLLHQGAISLETWLGRPAPLEAMRKGLMNAVAARQAHA